MQNVRNRRESRMNIERLEHDRRSVSNTPLTDGVTHDAASPRSRVALALTDLQVDERMSPTHLHQHDHPAVAAIDRQRISTLVAAYAPDPAACAFIVRCILDEGPIHHRGDNFVLLALLGEVLDRLPPAVGGEPREGAFFPVQMRIPPAHHATSEPKTYPLSIPQAPLALLDGGDPARRSTLAECLADGPPHHALANAMMVNLLHTILQRLPVRTAP
jgi:hypothetical protein